ncbi:MAG: hypothetical protein ABJB69_00140 [Spartobacteria bacterium]
MKKLFNITKREVANTSVFKAGLGLLAAVALASIFWFASTPLAQAATTTPAEMIQSKLPANMTIATSTDPQLLDAVCKAVKQHPREAGLIVRTAGGARKSIRSDILCMGLRCSREGKGVDCTWVLDVVREWIKTDPEIANQLTESVSQCAPDCRDALQSLGRDLGEGNFANPPANINPPPGSTGSGAGQNRCLVCHNGHEISIPCEEVAKYLKNHPGDNAGPCQPTPTTNQ